MHTNVRIDWYRRSEVNMADTRTDTQRGNLIHLLLFFQSKEIMSTNASLVRFITYLLEPAKKTVRHGASCCLVPHFLVRSRVPEYLVISCGSDANKCSRMDARFARTCRTARLTTQEPSRQEGTVAVIPVPERTLRKSIQKGKRFDVISFPLYLIDAGVCFHL